MTNNNAKTLLMVAVVFSIAIPFTTFSLASAELEGKTIIQPEFVKKVKEDRSKLEALEQAFGEASDDKTREAIKSQADLLMQKDRPSVAELEKSERYIDIKDELVAAITAMPKFHDDYYAIPFTGVGYDMETASLNVRIHQDYATLENMKNYEKTIRDIIGKDVDLKISNGGEYAIATTCPNGPLADCDPLESGVEWEVDNSPAGPCTIGMRATYGGDNGYVTAGHCVEART